MKSVFYTLFKYNYSQAWLLIQIIPGGEDLGGISMWFMGLFFQPPPDPLYEFPPIIFGFFYAFLQTKIVRVCNPSFLLDLQIL